MGQHLLIVLCLAGLTSAAHGATYYVSPDGRDADPGTEDRPWRTVQRAADSLLPGDTVLIGEGTYNERVVVNRSGEAGKPITFAPVPGATVTIDGGDLPRSWGLFEMHDRSFIVISGLTVANARGVGILIRNSKDVTVEQCHTVNTGSSGIMSWAAENVVIAGNEVERACQRGGEESVTIKFDSAFVEVRDNHIHHTRHEGIDVKEGAHDVRVYGNHIHHVERQGLYADAWDRETHSIWFFNNVVHECGFGLAVCAETGGVLRNVRAYNNVIYNTPGPGLVVADWGRRSAAHPVRDVVFANNTLHNTGFRWGGGMLIENTEARDIVVVNNIFSSTGPPHILINRQPESLLIDHNLFHGEGEIRGGSHVEGDPMFVDPAAGDFRLRPGSPAIDAATPAYAPGFDLDKDTRPHAIGAEPTGTAPDIGAHEHVTDEETAT